MYFSRPRQFSRFHCARCSFTVNIVLGRSFLNIYRVRNVSVVKILYSVSHTPVQSGARDGPDWTHTRTSFSVGTKSVRFWPGQQVNVLRTLDDYGLTTTTSRYWPWLGRPSGRRPRARPACTATAAAAPRRYGVRHSSPSCRIFRGVLFRRSVPGSRLRVRQRGIIYSDLTRLPDRGTHATLVSSAARNGARGGNESQTSWQ